MNLDSLKTGLIQLQNEIEVLLPREVKTHSAKNKPENSSHSNLSSVDQTVYNVWEVINEVNTFLNLNVFSWISAKDILRNSLERKITLHTAKPANITEHPDLLSTLFDVPIIDEKTLTLAEALVKFAEFLSVHAEPLIKNLPVISLLKNYVQYYVTCTQNITSEVLKNLRTRIREYKLKNSPEMENLATFQTLLQPHKKLIQTKSPSIQDEKKLNSHIENVRLSLPAIQTLLQKMIEISQHLPDGEFNDEMTNAYNTVIHETHKLHQSLETYLNELTLEQHNRLDEQAFLNHLQELDAQVRQLTNKSENIKKLVSEQENKTSFIKGRYQESTQILNDQLTLSQDKSDISALVSSVKNKRKKFSFRSAKVTTIDPVEEMKKKEEQQKQEEIRAHNQQWESIINEENTYLNKLKTDDLTIAFDYQQTVKLLIANKKLGRDKLTNKLHTLEDEITTACHLIDAQTKEMQNHQQAIDRNNINPLIEHIAAKKIELANMNAKINELKGKIQKIEQDVALLENGVIDNDFAQIRTQLVQIKTRLESQTESNSSSPPFKTLALLKNNFEKSIQEAETVVRHIQAEKENRVQYVNTQKGKCTTYLKERPAIFARLGACLLGCFGYTPAKQKRDEYLNKKVLPALEQYAQEGVSDHLKGIIQSGVALFSPRAKQGKAGHEKSLQFLLKNMQTQLN